MYFRVNSKMKKPTFCYCFTWIVFIELNFTVVFLLIKKTWDDGFFDNSVHPLFLLLPGGGGLSVLPNFQKEGLDRISIFRGGLVGKRAVTFLGGLSFYIKK